MATGIVLAGGASRSMGREKASVELGGTPLIKRVVNALRDVCNEILIVANDTERFEPLGLPIIPDVIPDRGSLGGLYSGLLAARNDWTLAVACDMPFLNVALLRFLMSLSSDCDVIIPS